MITLSSDFGTPYPGAMKGVILQESDARLVDVGHDFPRQDVRATAFWLREVLPYFPPAVHLVVVDPGVGTERAAVVIRAGEHALVGPDNGVLVPPARALAGGDEEQADDDPADADLEVFDVPIEDPESTTFHGRDVFAPAAAAVHEAGIDALPDEGGFERTGDFVDLSFPEPTVSETGASGEVLVVDDFGNAITNVPGHVVAERFGDQLRINGEPAPARQTYAAVGQGERLVTVGSHGNVELAVNRGRGDEAFGVGSGDRVEIEF